jgi:hypothetical protein
MPRRLDGRGRRPRSAVSTCAFTHAESAARLDIADPRHLRMEYGRAARPLETMEGDVVSVRDNDGLRKVLVLDGAA